MKNLFETTRAQEVKERLARLRSDSQHQWGSMNAAQAVAHCSGGFEMALGDTQPPRMFMGRIIGGLIKGKVLGDDEPMRKNSPTVKGLVIKDDRDLAAEQKRLFALIDRFTAGGRNRFTAHPHSFFGQLTPDEWAILMYKHLDHHLRQFGV